MIMGPNCGVWEMSLDSEFQEIVFLTFCKVIHFLVQENGELEVAEAVNFNPETFLLLRFVF